MVGPLGSLASIIGCSILTGITFEISWRAWVPLAAITTGIGIWSVRSLIKQFDNDNRDRGTKELCAFSIVTSLCYVASGACTGFFPFRPFMVALHLVILVCTPSLILLFAMIKGRHSLAMTVVGALVTLVGYGWIVLYVKLKLEPLLTGILLTLHGIVLLITGFAKIKAKHMWTTRPLISLTILIGCAVSTTIAVSFSLIAVVPMLMIMCGTIAWSAFCVNGKLNPRIMFAISATLTMSSIISTGLCYSRGWTIAIPSGLLLAFFVHLLQKTVRHPNMRKVSRVTLIICHILLIGSVPLSFMFHFVAPLACPIALITICVCTMLIFSAECSTYGICNGCVSVCFVLEILAGASIITAYAAEMLILRMILCAALLINTYVFIGCGSQHFILKEWMPAASHVMFIANALWFHLAYFYDPLFYPVTVLSSIVGTVMLVLIEYYVHGLRGIVRAACVVQLVLAASHGILLVAFPPLGTPVGWAAIVLIGWPLFSCILSGALAGMFIEESTDQPITSAVWRPWLQPAALFIIIVSSVSPFIAYRHVRATIPALVPFLTFAFTVLYQLAVFIMSNLKENIKYNGRIGAFLLAVCIYVFITGFSLEDKSYGAQMAAAAVPILTVSVHFLSFFLANKQIDKARKKAAASLAARAARHPQRYGQ